MRKTFDKNIELIAQRLLKIYPHIFNNRRLYLNLTPYYFKKKGRMFKAYRRTPRAFNPLGCLCDHLAAVHDSLPRKEKNLPYEELYKIMVTKVSTIYINMGLFPPTIWQRFRLFLMRLKRRVGRCLGRKGKIVSHGTV